MRHWICIEQWNVYVTFGKDYLSSFRVVGHKKVQSDLPVLTQLWIHTKRVKNIFF